MVSITVVEKGNGFLYFNISAPVVSTWNFNGYGQPTPKDQFKYSYCTLDGSVKQTTPTSLPLTLTTYDKDSDAFFYATKAETPEKSLPVGNYLFTVWQQTWNSEANNGKGAYEDVIGRKQVLIVSIEHGINTVIAGSLDSTAGLIKLDYEANGYTNKNQQHIKVVFTDANPDRVKEFSAAVYNENGDLQTKASTGIHQALGFEGENLLIKWESTSGTDIALYINGDQIKEDSDGNFVTGSEGFLRRIDEIDTYIKTSSTNSIICKVSKEKVYNVTIMYSSGTDINQSVAFTIQYTPKPVSLSNSTSFYLQTVNSKKNWDGTIEYDDGINGWRIWDGKRINAGQVNGKYVLKLRGYGNTVLSGKDDSTYGWTFGGIENLDLSDFDLYTILDCKKDKSNIKIGDYAFAYLFNNCTKLVKTPKLDTIELSKGCYKNMFSVCTKLTVAPELPATVMEDYCYSNMFYGCSTLTETPTLPATSLASHCYESMFYNCKKLNQTSTLPATEMKDYCYANMFYGCSTLTETPTLPATSLASHCYEAMFYSCQKISQITTLPASTMKDYCYSQMFTQCSAITVPPALPATELAEYCYYYMFSENSFQQPPALPALTMKSHCYEGMFNKCSKLLTTPVLNANTVADSCYKSMFEGCIAITEYPSLPAKTMANNCYEKMFANCVGVTNNNGKSIVISAETLAKECFQCMFTYNTKLTVIPELHSTVMAENCYAGMFANCSSITAVPELKSKQLASGCYKFMFSKCTSVLTATNLPATTLQPYCYDGMFAHTAISVVPKLPATKMAEACYCQMFIGCKNIKSVPEDYLPSTSLATMCYSYMFTQTGIEKAPALPTPSDKLEQWCYYGMFQECSSLTDLTLTGEVYLPTNSFKMVDDIWPGKYRTYAWDSMHYMFADCSSIKVYSTTTNLDVSGKTIKKIFENLPSYQCDYVSNEFILVYNMFGQPNQIMHDGLTNAPVRYYFYNRKWYDKGDPTPKGSGAKNTPEAGQTYFILI